MDGNNDVLEKREVLLGLTRAFLQLFTHASCNCKTMPHLAPSRLFLSPYFVDASDACQAGQQPVALVETHKSGSFSAFLADILTTCRLSQAGPVLFSTLKETLYPGEQRRNVIDMERRKPQVPTSWKIVVKFTDE